MLLRVLRVEQTQLPFLASLFSSVFLHLSGMYYAWEISKCMQSFSRETLREETTWETWDRSEHNIKIYLIQTRFVAMGYIYLVQDRVQWPTVLNFRFLRTPGNFMTI